MFIHMLTSHYGFITSLRMFIVFSVDTDSLYVLFIVNQSTDCNYITEDCYTGFVEYSTG